MNTENPDWQAGGFKGSRFASTSTQSHPEPSKASEKSSQGQKQVPRAGAKLEEDSR